MSTVTIIFVWYILEKITKMEIGTKKPFYSWQNYRGKKASFFYNNTQFIWENDLV